jgi:DNA-binding LacI/PurR family transcriptional regulator
MKPIRLLSAAEQVAAHLRGEILRGGLSGEMPGIHQLAAGLVANHKTVKSALGLLEKEGLLVAQGAGRARRIAALKDGSPVPSLRVAILNYDPPDMIERYVIELLHGLLAAGHSAFFSGKSLTEMGMNLRRVTEHVRQNEADVWVVIGGSREVLEWFAALGKPAFAFFGRRGGLPIAGVGPDKVQAYTDLTRHLVGLGHRRIVLLARRERRLPQPGASERAFLAELKSHGIAIGSYHLPDWEETVAGFHTRLDSLFQSTPPTALITDEAPYFLAAMQFLMARGLRVPQDVSLVCSDGDPGFAWFRPPVSHIDWDSAPVVRRAVRWAANIARGKPDLRQTLTKAEFVVGGTIGPANG